MVEAVNTSPKNKQTKVDKKAAVGGPVDPELAEFCQRLPVFQGQKNKLEDNVLYLRIEGSGFFFPTKLKFLKKKWNSSHFLGGENFTLTKLRPPIYTWNPNDLYFWRSTPQNKAFSNQNNGHLGSRHIYYISITLEPCKSPASMRKAHELPSWRITF